MKKITFYFMIFALFSFASCQKDAEVEPNNPEVSEEVKAVWSSSDRWASWNNGGYTLYNNIWGSGYGPQVIWANNFQDWGVWANHPNTGGIKSYPNVSRTINKRLSSLTRLTSSYTVAARPSDGSYNSAYDIWLRSHQIEVMLWMNYRGSMKPISHNWDSNGNPVPTHRNISVGGHTWNVYRGSHGNLQVYSFVRTSQSDSGTVDIRAVLNWLRNTPRWIGDETVNQVQFGWEITSSSGGRDFRISRFNVLD